VPEQMRPLMVLQGIKPTEKISRERFKGIFEEMRKRFQRPKKDP
jgi:hypothetical protein